MEYVPKPNIVSDLRELIADSADVQTGKLPPERVIADRLGRSRRSIRDGLAVLESEGILRRRQGQGTFIVGQDESPIANLEQQLEQISPVEVIEVRLALEPRQARLAALRASKCDIRRLEGLTDAAASAKDPATYRRFDAAFHRKIAEAARNQLLLLVFDLVTANNGDPTTLLLGETGRCDKRKAVYASHHRDIVQAIIARDPDAAERAMHRHIADVQKQFE